tara:strand:+ start:152 stop:883 length:732 start_codon:yes stop_codon:yes gene_type:complete
MKICLFVSGHVRTLLYKFYENIDLIKNTLNDCQIDVRYSFWDDYSLGGRMNDPWHIQSNDFTQPKISTEIIDNYFLSHGVENVQGEIESTNIMNDVLSKTNFLPENSGRNVLSSQYYKKYRVIEKYFNNDYDFYIQIRSDVIINNFLDNDSILNLINKKLLVVNKFYWYNEPYCGGDCNEMISCSGKQIFKDFNQLYLSEKYISQQLDYHYGERVTGRHINNLIEKSVIDNVLVFDFDYRVIR